MGLDAWLLRSLAAALCLHAGAVPAQGSAQPWPVSQTQPAATLKGLADRAAAAGRDCSEALVLPQENQILALCRPAASSKSTSLRLLLIQAGGTAQPVIKEIANLADATGARLRLFTPTEACRSKESPACLTAVVLVDQRDESSCYGTQVLVSTSLRSLHSVGFIDEVSIDNGTEVCVGPSAVVTGSGRLAAITLPGPLAKIDGQGGTQAIKAKSVQYSVAAAQPSLRRVVPTR